MPINVLFRREDARTGVIHRAVECGEALVSAERECQRETARLRSYPHGANVAKAKKGVKGKVNAEQKRLTEK